MLRHEGSSFVTTHWRYLPLEKRAVVVSRHKARLSLELAASRSTTFLATPPFVGCPFTVSRVLRLRTNGALGSRHGIVAAELILSTMASFQPLAGCSPRAALYVLDPQIGDTDAMGGKIQQDEGS